MFLYYSIQSEWCKTDQQSGLENIDPSGGGPDWGYCKEKVNPSNTIDQQITMFNIEGQELKGKMNIILVGDSTTEQFLLNSNGPIKNLEENFSVTQTNVGDVWAIELSVAENNGEKFLFLEMQIKKGIFKQIFRPQNYIQEDKTYVMAVSGSADWRIKIHKEINKTCSGVLRIKLTGNIRKSQFVIITHRGLSPTEKMTEFSFKTHEVGSIESVTFSRITDDATSQCEINEIHLEKLPAGKVVFTQKIKEPVLTLLNMKIRLPKNIVKDNLEDPDDENRSALANAAADEDAPVATPSTTVPLQELEQKKKTQISQYASLAIGSQQQQVYNASQCYTNDLVSQIVKFGCDDKLDPITHFDIQQTGTIQIFQGKKSLLIHCEKQCFQDRPDEVNDVVNNPVKGLTVHPIVENPCRAAYVDRVMPKYGGVVMVNLAPGSETDVPVKPISMTGDLVIRNVKIEPVGPSDINYQLTPVDNINFIKNKIRILNNEHNLATKGMLEILIDGEWNAVCKMSDPKIPKIACEMLGFSQGFIVEDNNFIDLQPSRFRRNAARKNIMCGVSTTKLDDCFLFEESKCNKSDMDMYVRCSNFIPFNSLKDKTEIGQLNPSGETEMFPKFVNETTVNGEVKQEDIDFCFPNSLDNDIIMALNTICHQRKFKNYSGITEAALESSTCWQIEGCNECGFDIVDNLKKSLKTVDQTTRKLVLRCKDTANLEQAEPLQGQERSPVLPVKSIDCNDTLKTLSADKYARGEAGSSFLVWCSSECAGQSDKKVYGNAQFSEDTSICYAALQRDIESELFQVTVGQPMVEFKENLQNAGVSSVAYNLNQVADRNQSVSFTVSDQSPCLLKSCDDDLINAQNTDANQSSFMQVQSYIKQKRNDSNIFKKKLSFIQISSEQATLGQHWQFNQFFKCLPTSQQQSEKFENLNSINTMVQPIFSKDQWSIFFGQRMMDKPPNGQSISLFRLEGEIGFAIVVKTLDNLSSIYLQTFTDGVVDKSYKLTFQVEENQAALDQYCLTFNNKTLTAFKGTKKATINDFNIGSLSQLNSDETQTKSQLIIDAAYSGWVKYIFYFDTALDPEKIKEFEGKIELFKPPFKNATSEVTTDNRICKTPCSREPIPAGGSSTARNDELNDSLKVDLEAAPEVDKTCFNVGSDFLQCKLNMNDMSVMADKFPDFVEHQSYRICCPDTCEWDTIALHDVNNDYGFNIYSPENSVCRAAKNENLTTDGKIVEVQFTITKIPKNNIVVNASLGFRVTGAPTLPLLNCGDTLEQNEKLFGGKNGKSQAAQCPKNCFTRFKMLTKEDPVVKGNYLEMGQSEDSSVCQSALHAGLLSDSFSKELNFEIVASDTQIRFNCGKMCNHNGIKAGDKKWQRGFKFMEANMKCREINYKFDDKTLFSDFKQSKGTDDPTTQALWSGLDSTVFNRIVLINERRFDMQPMHSQMILDSSECINGRVSVNIYFSENLLGKKFAALIFRQINIGDEESFYYVSLSSQKLGLNIYKTGVSQEISSVPVKQLKNTIQNITVLQETSDIQVFVQTGNERQRFRQLRSTDNQISRGRVGLGLNDSDKIQFDSLAMGEAVLPVQKDIKNQDDCLKPRSKNDRTRFCDPIGCTNILQQCGQCCGTLFNKFETSDIYNCKKECLKTSFPDLIANVAANTSKS